MQITQGQQDAIVEPEWEKPDGTLDMDSLLVLRKPCKEDGIFDRRSGGKKLPWDERIKWEVEGSITVVGCYAK